MIAFSKNLLLPFTSNEPLLKLIEYTNFLHKPQACQNNYSPFMPKDALSQSNHGILSLVTGLIAMSFTWRVPSKKKLR